MNYSNYVFHIVSGWGISKKIFAGSFMSEANHYLYDLSAPVKAARNDKYNILIGWSFGGLAVLESAMLFRNQVHAIILLASQPRFIEDNDYLGIRIENARQFVNLTKEAPIRAYQHFTKAASYPSKVSFLECYALKNHNTTLLEKYMFMDLRDSYSKLQLPILHLTGSRDAIIRQSAKCLKTLNPKITYKSINNAGHALFLTHAQDCNSAIQTFLKDHNDK